MTSMSMAGNRIYIDAGGFIAVASKKDRFHRIANTFFQEIITQKTIQITTNLVLSETYTYLRYHESHQVACRFLESIRRAEKVGFLFIVYSDHLLEEKAFEVLKKFNDQDLSYADAVSFAYLEIDQETRDVFTFDSHFYFSGRNILPLHKHKE